MTIRNMALSQLRSEGYLGIGFTGRRKQDGIRPETTREAPQTNAAIRGAGENISTALKGLTGAEGELQGNTSDSTVATVSVDNKRTIASMPPKDLSVNVHQIAEAQTNVGKALTASMRDVTEGTHSFEITANGKTHSFDIEVQSDDNNLSIQRKMATAINDANIGVTASVKSGTDSGATVSTLTVAATQTGTDARFTISDNSGNLVSAMGIDGSTADSRVARNANYTVNDGETRESQSNTINIAAGVNMTLADTGRADISFGVSPDQKMTAARNLVNAVNSAIRGTNPNDGRGSERFLNDIIGATVNFTPSLARVGIDVQKNGQLAIDESKLKTAIEDGSFDRIMSGFTNRMERVSSNASNTRQYANSPPPVNVSNNSFDFSNTNSSWMFMDLFS